MTRRMIYRCLMLMFCVAAVDVNVIVEADVFVAKADVDVIYCVCRYERGCSECDLDCV